MDVMPMFMIIALDVFIITHFSINCSIVICSPTVILVILREATSEIYGPWISFLLYYISFIYIASRLLFCNLLLSIPYTKNTKTITLPFIYLYQISLLQVTVMGLTTPLSRWVQVFDCLCRYSVICALSPTRLIPWLSKNQGNTYATLLHHPFLFKGKPTQCSRGSTR